MKLIDDVKRRVLAGLAPAAVLLAVSYFCYHLVEGDRGLFAYFNLLREIEQAEAVHETVAARRDRLERRALLLSPSSLDVDLLEERARAELGLAHPDEIVIYIPENG